MMLNRRWLQRGGAALAAALALTALPAAAQDTLQPGEPIEIELDGQNPVEFVYAGSEGEVISIAARSLESQNILDPTLTVLDPDGEELASNDDHDDSEIVDDLADRDAAIEDLELPADGDYTIIVDSFSGAAVGGVEVTLIADGSSGQDDDDNEDEDDNQDDDDNEDDDDNQDEDDNQDDDDTATDGEVIEGEVEEDETFEYAFEAAEGDVVTIIVRGLDDFDPVASVLNEDEDVIAENDDHRSDNDDLGRRDSLIEDLEIEEDGEYTVVVAGYGGEAGEFELTVTFGGSSADDDEASDDEDADDEDADDEDTSEDEDTAEEDDTNTTGGETVTGEIEAGDTFTYEFEGSEGDVVTIAVRGEDGFDPVLALLTEEGELLAENDDHGSEDESLSTRDSLLEEVELPDDGTYIIEVRGFGDAEGSFEISLNGGSGEETSADDEEANADDEEQTDDEETDDEQAEDDDDTAGEETISGTVESGSTFTYEFEAQEGDVVTITVRGQDSFDPVTTLLNEDGDLVAENDDHGTEDETLASFDSQIAGVEIEADGTYTVEVRGYADTAGEVEITIVVE